MLYMFMYLYVVFLYFRGSQIQSFTFFFFLFLVVGWIHQVQTIPGSKVFNVYTMTASECLILVPDYNKCALKRWKKKKRKRKCSTEVKHSFKLSICFSSSADKTSIFCLCTHSGPGTSSDLYILIPQPSLPWDQLTLSSYTEQLSLLMCFFKTLP